MKKISKFSIFLLFCFVFKNASCMEEKKSKIDKYLDLDINLLVSKNHITQIKEYIKNGKINAMNINQPVNKVNATSLTIAALNSQYKIAKALIKHGAKITKKTADGRTMLHWTALGVTKNLFWNSLVTLKLFLENTPYHISVKDKHGLIPFDIILLNTCIEQTRILGSSISECAMLMFLQKGVQPNVSKLKENKKTNKYLFKMVEDIYPLFEKIKKTPNNKECILEKIKKKVSEKTFNMWQDIENKSIGKIKPLEWHKKINIARKEKQFTDCEIVTE